MRITRSTATRRTAFSPCGRALTGFTILELTAVVAIISILVSLLCAALNQTRAKALRISCVDNFKQLQLAWEMYMDDNDGSLPLNQTEVGPVHHRIPLRNTSSNSWVAGNPRLDTSPASIRRGTLYRYVKSASVYRCPMDSSSVEGRPDLPRTRSYSMNAYLGGDEALNPALKFAELNRPANTFVFIEEHENSRWESSFVVIPGAKPGKLVATGAAATSWVSTPADRHEQGCNISFADGHIEYWRWYTPKLATDSMLSSSGNHQFRDIRDLSRLQSVVGQ